MERYIVDTNVLVQFATELDFTDTINSLTKLQQAPSVSALNRGNLAAKI